MSDTALDATRSSLSFAPGTRSEAKVAGKEHVIDAMRGFAALLVAYFHCRQVEWVGMQSFHHVVGKSFDLNTIVAYLTLPIAWGSAGVPIFFVISGYCIHRGAAQRLANDSAYRLDAMNFWARRFARIYPVLFAALLLTLALDWASLQFPPSITRFSISGRRRFLSICSRCKAWPARRMGRMARCGRCR